MREAVVITASYHITYQTQQSLELLSAVVKMAIIDPVGTSLKTEDKCLLNFVALYKSLHFNINREH